MNDKWDAYCEGLLVRLASAKSTLDKAIARYVEDGSQGPLLLVGILEERIRDIESILSARGY